MGRPHKDESSPRNLRERIARLFRRLSRKVVMDAPPEWDMHPDVAKKIREREGR
jgi:hypothetical protein